MTDPAPLYRPARDFGIIRDTMPTGPNNAITDVPGLRVAHVTLSGNGQNSGVTAILPHDGDVFRHKVAAASSVINGFGKSTGLIQVDELGQIETPVLLTNTFGVPACATALIRAALEANPDIGRRTSTVNPVVLECNDGPLSDIRALAITPDYAALALKQAAGQPPFAPVEQGAVGAGTGMSCFGFKGGNGTASRRLRLDRTDHYLGVLVLTNFGRAGDLILPDGRRPVPGSGPAATLPGEDAAPERGSVIIILATDIPLDHRQLRRVIRRCGAGLARLGSVWGHGSGDIVLGLCTAQTIPHDGKQDLITLRMLNENRIDMLFRAAAGATEEAVLNSLCTARPMTGFTGTGRPSLADWLAGQAHLPC